MLEEGTVGDRKDRRKRDSELVERAEPTSRMSNVDQAYKAQS